MYYKDDGKGAPKKKTSRRSPHLVSSSSEPNLTQTSPHPLVTVCIPTYNGEQFLGEALESVAEQTYPNLEILLADDGSEDATLEILEDFRDNSPHPCRIYRHSHRGMVQNWNFCIHEARGVYLKFLFQDDRLDPDCIRQLVNVAETDAEMGLVFCPRRLDITDDAAGIGILEIVAQRCRHVHRGWRHLNSRQAGTTLLGDCQLWRFPLNKIGEPTAVLLRKSAVEAVGGFDPDLSQLVDVELWWRLLATASVGFVDEPLAVFRLHPGQQTVKNALAGKFDEGRFFLKIAQNPIFAQEIRQQATWHWLQQEDWRCQDWRSHLQEIPPSLWPDWLQQILSQTPQWRDRGEAKTYTQGLMAISDYLLARIQEQPQQWQHAAQVYSLQVSLLPTYYNDVSLDELLRQRRQILQFFLQSQGYPLHWQFPSPNSGKTGVYLETYPGHLPETGKTIYSPQPPPKSWPGGNWIQLPTDLRGQIQRLREENLDELQFWGDSVSDIGAIAFLELHQLARSQRTFEDLPLWETGDKTGFLPTSLTPSIYHSTTAHLGQALEREIFDLKQRLDIASAPVIFVTVVSPDDLTVELRETWASIIQSCPQSLLLLLLSKNDEQSKLGISSRDRLRETWTQFNLSRQQLIVVDRPDWQQQPLWWDVGDIYLDSFPVNSPQTVQMALRKNQVPVLYFGKTRRSQTSVNTFSGTIPPESIAQQESDYINLAQKLGTDRHFRQEILRKLKLAQGMKNPS
ncbi:MAG: glycosyltransferase [Phormidium sp. GEM2.Bin31]|nr:MAG: glycosyltransferase [Phormidium sp. GEM2.Bin31]